MIFQKIPEGIIIDAEYSVVNWKLICQHNMQVVSPLLSFNSLFFVIWRGLRHAALFSNRVVGSLCYASAVSGHFAVFLVV